MTMTVYIIYIGAEDCIKEVDEALWSQAMREEALSPPRFYPRDCENNALQFIEEELGLSHAELASNNWRTVYLHMIRNL